MSNAQIKKIVKRYTRVLEKSDFPFFAVYLFGSHVRGNIHRGSDIDVAVVSDTLKKNQEERRLMLWRLRRRIDSRIEPHGFTLQEFASETDPVVHEVRSTGIRVA